MKTLKTLKTFLRALLASDISIIAISIVAMVLVVFALVGAYDYDRERQKHNKIELPGTAATSSVPHELADNLRIVCIEGHSYYYASWKKGAAEYSIGYAILAPKLLNNGDPAGCFVEQFKPEELPKRKN